MADEARLKQIIMQETGLDDRSAEFMSLCTLCLARMPDQEVRDIAVQIHCRAVEEIRDMLKTGEMPKWLVSRMNAASSMPRA